MSPHGSEADMDGSNFHAQHLCDLGNWHVQVFMSAPDSRLFDLGNAPARSSGTEGRA
jgi:hypothetical protein